MQSAAWQNYFFSQAETNDILNEINRMNGHINNMIRPVQEAYFIQKRDDMKKEFELDYVSTRPSYLCNS